MEFSRSAAALLLAPVIYFFAGLPWAVAVRRMAWAPLFGAAAFGLTGELAYILGAPVSTAVVVVALLHFVAGGLILGRTAECAAVLKAEMAGFAGSYAIALSPLLAAPFSIPGAWGGDWAVALASGEHILHAARFTSELLARPPLFGAASIPALLLAPPMEGFQVFCAVASACALQVFRSGLKPGANPILVWILAGSVFFLQITANAWPKFLSAAFLLAAWQAAGGTDRRRPGLAGVLLGLAIATHQSAVLFAPLLLTRLRGSRAADRIGAGAPDPGACGRDRGSLGNPYDCGLRLGGQAARQSKRLGPARRPVALAQWVARGSDDVCRVGSSGGRFFATGTRVPGPPFPSSGSSMKSTGSPPLY